MSYCVFVDFFVDGLILGMFILRKNVFGQNKTGYLLK